MSIEAQVSFTRATDFDVIRMLVSVVKPDGETLFLSLGLKADQVRHVEEFRRQAKAAGVKGA